jgi:hypothetical protein
VAADGDVDEGADTYERRFQQRRLASMKVIAKQMGYELIPVGAPS